MDFTAASSDEDFRFEIHADGEWRRRRRHHHDPAAVASCHVIDEVTRIAATCTILAPAELEHRTNTLLGQAADLLDAGVRVTWATAHIHVGPEDLHTAQTRMRLLARARTEWEINQLRLSQAVTYRNQLREDPTLVLAQLLLESPEAITQETVNIIPSVAEKVAAYAPGAAWVETAHLLEESFGKLAPDAKQFVIDRLCTALTEFGAEAATRRLKEAHGGTPLGTQPAGSVGLPGEFVTSTDCAGPVPPPAARHDNSSGPSGSQPSV
ncbi:hypothetical protein OG372_14285 [Streptomyces sp. NBC_01020]|uniref:hypothetical protein n=1 Tax=unclassified Streptomyces TaxID=2593676 RepID=UPI002E1D89EE|nr:hypothetical protein OG372_14285 [Streptomyces sp. NBC_01020]